MLFTVFKLANHTSPAGVAKRMAAIESHYNAHMGVNVQFVRFYDESSRIGCHIVWQRFPNEKFIRCTETDSEIVAYTGFPYGYTEIAPPPPPEIGSHLAKAFLRDPLLIEKMHPPFSLVHVDKLSKIVRVYTDVAGYVRTFRLDSMSGFAISNRSIAPFIATLTNPSLSDLGWAAEQFNGYMYGELTAFSELKRSLPGTRYVISPRGVRVESDWQVMKWFSSSPPNPFHGLARLAKEADQIGDYDSISVAITGGRDSRASAAFAFKFFGNRAKAFTSYPPALERTIARQLAEREPTFYRFENDDHAVRKDGSTIWRGNQRKPPNRSDMLTRARGWAYIHEGSGIMSALYNNCGMKSMFSHHTVNNITVPGNGGELAKAYSYRPMQVSGVYAADQKKWLREVKSIPAYERLETHSTTGKASLYFVHNELWNTLSDYLYSRFTEAQDHGIEGYRFFDYWYLVGRMAGAQTPDYTHSSSLLPFLVPEFIRAAGMDTLERKINVQLSRDMVSEYVPEWSSVPYYDEIQKHTPVDQLTFFREDELLWAGPSAKEFFEILEDSPAFDDPYDRKKLVAHYRAADTNGVPHATSNVKAHSLMYRFAVYELAQDVGQKINDLRSERFRRYAAVRTPAPSLLSALKKAVKLT